MFNKKIDNYHKALELIEKMIENHKSKLKHYCRLCDYIDVAREDATIMQEINYHKGQIAVLEGLLDKLITSIGA